MDDWSLNISPLRLPGDRDEASVSGKSQVLFMAPKKLNENDLQLQTRAFITIFVNDNHS